METLQPRTFYDQLVAELSERRAACSEAEQSFGSRQPMGPIELLEWVSFQAWYEAEAAKFIGAWLQATPEPDAFHGLARQVADEARHHKLFVEHLKHLGGSLEGWTPEPEWVDWIVTFYPAGDDTLERIAAHNITGEIGALQAFEDLGDRIPAETWAVIETIRPDELFHIALGRSLVRRYADTPDRQARVRARALEAFEREQAGRRAYARRIAARTGTPV
jgi:hypothetical protein